MNRRELIRRAIELGEKIDNEPNSTLQKVDWIIIFLIFFYKINQNIYIVVTTYYYTTSTIKRRC